MNIYEQILAKLQTKFQGADAATLQRIATKKSEGVTDESKVDEIIGSISFLDVMNNYGDFRANGASVTAKKNAIADYEKQYGLKDGKPLEAGGGAGGEGGQGGNGGDGGNGGQGGNGGNGGQQFDMQAITKMISEGVTAGLKPITDRLNNMDAAAAKATRDAQIDAVAKSFKIPAFAYKGKEIPADADLNKYFMDLKQEMQNEGFQFTASPDEGGGKPKDDVDGLVDTINKGTQAITEEQKKQK